MIHPSLSCQRIEKKKKGEAAFIVSTFFFFLFFFCLLLGAWAEAIPAAEPETCGLGSLLCSAPDKHCDYRPSGVFWWSSLKPNLGGRPENSLENLAPTWPWE